MGMTIEEAVLELKWLKEVNQEILKIDTKELDIDGVWIKHWESVTQALDIAIDTARKYQMMQADSNARLKDDMAAIRDKLNGMWIPVKDPINELPIEKPIWVTSRGGRFLGVEQFYYTKSALDKLFVEDVIAYMDYVKPEPYQWWNKEQTDGNVD